MSVSVYYAQLGEDTMLYMLNSAVVWLGIFLNNFLVGAFRVNLCGYFYNSDSIILFIVFLSGGIILQWH